MTESPNPSLRKSPHPGEKYAAGHPSHGTKEARIRKNYKSPSHFSLETIYNPHVTIQRRLPRILALAVAFTFVSFPAVSEANEGSSTNSAEKLGAKSLMDRGNALFAEGQFLKQIMLGLNSH